MLSAKPGNGSRDWDAFGAKLRHNAHLKAIHDIVTNISVDHTEGQGNRGKTLVLYDKFHNIQNVVEACDQARRAESRSDAGKRGRSELKRSMWIKNLVE